MKRERDLCPVLAVLTAKGDFYLLTEMETNKYLNGDNKIGGIM